MKTIIFCLLTIGTSSLLYCQSSIVYGTSTNIDVGTGADVSAGTITVNGTYTGSGTFNNGPLPVELVSFNAIVVKDKIELNWKTATELNNYGFDIERASASGNLRGQEAIPGKSDLEGYKSIGFVAGNGNSNSPKEYHFIDNTATSGSYAYRLKQLDNDGTFKYSETVEANVGHIPNDYSLNQNYPNPFNPSTTIAYDIPKTSFVRISVYDILGKEIKLVVNEQKNSGHYEIIFDAKELAGGIYYYTIKTGEFSLSKKMILLK